jgi:hypothetical protein
MRFNVTIKSREEEEEEEEEEKKFLVLSAFRARSRGADATSPG